MIRLENICKSFGEHTVFDRFELSVEEGESVAALGPSGCGKTTLLRILAGLEREYTGHVYLEGSPADELPCERRGTALVMQEPVLWPHMTVKENILFPLRREKRRKSGEIFGHVCAELGIGDLLKRLPGQLSGGQAKRVSLARALCADKRILLLDEPLSNIDDAAKERILTFLRREYKGRSTMVYVTHMAAEAEFLCDRMVYL